MVMEATADIIKQLKNEIDKEGGDPDGLQVPTEDERNELMAGTPEPSETKKEPEVVAADAVGDEEDDDATEDDALSDDAKKRGKAFGAMRQELRDAKERADKLEEARQQMAERMARLEGRADASAPAAAKEDAEPDALLYPEDHRDWREKRLEARLAKAEAVAAEAAGFANYQKESRGVALLETTFKSANPTEDYDGAVKFMVKRERAMKKLMNPKLTDAQADAQTESEKVTLFKSLYAQGRDPAKVVLDMAKAQGYTAGADKGGGKEFPAKTNLQKLADNQRRSANLMGGSPAGKSKATLTADDVLGMSFSKLLKLPKSERDRLANGGEE